MPAARESYAQRPDGSAVVFALTDDRAGMPVLVCHGLADSRRCVRLLERAAQELGLLLIVPDRPGVGMTDPCRLERVRDWTHDAAVVLDVLSVDCAAVVGVSGGGAFAAACAAALPARIRSLLLVSALGIPEWGTGGMAAGERLSLSVATRTPSFGGWFLERLATLARSSPRLFFEIATVELPAADRFALASGLPRQAFIDGYLEAFRRGRAGMTQDLRLLTSPWGFPLESIRVPTRIHHGDADTTVPPEHARHFARAIPGARLRLHPGEGHFSLLARSAAEVLSDVLRA